MAQKSSKQKIYMIMYKIFVSIFTLHVVFLYQRTFFFSIYLYFSLHLMVCFFYLSVSVCYFFPLLWIVSCKRANCPDSWNVAVRGSSYLLHYIVFRFWQKGLIVVGKVIGLVVQGNCTTLFHKTRPGACTLVDALAIIMHYSLYLQKK